MNDVIKWRYIYDKSEQVRNLADKIHSSRMLPPPTCDQCIEMAVKQLKQDPPPLDVEFMMSLMFPQTKSK